MAERKRKSADGPDAGINGGIAETKALSCIFAQLFTRGNMKERRL